MRRLLLVFCIFAAVHAANIGAQEPDSQTARQQDPLPVSRDPPPQGGLFPRFRGRALVLEINARVVEQDETVIWNESHQKTTLPGRPVEIKLVGANLVVVAQFTPVRRGVQKILIAQGQIWMEIPGHGIRYYTSIQTIPLEFGEPIFFFPLGPQSSGDTARIELMLTLNPYEE
jgi:hypothetical protein